ncbi:hypothetical protein EI94DRAFT_1889209 [Lactarius quietus]|nr:hypothetical protein EI94DRAFT_1889209 [Lactarius quietus]
MRGRRGYSGSEDEGVALLIGAVAILRGSDVLADVGSNILGGSLWLGSDPARMRSPDVVSVYPQGDLRWRRRGILTGDAAAGPGSAEAEGTEAEVEGAGGVIGWIVTLRSPLVGNSRCEPTRSSGPEREARAQRGPGRVPALIPSVTASPSTNPKSSTGSNFKGPELFFFQEIMSIICRIHPYQTTCNESSIKDIPRIVEKPTLLSLFNLLEH